MHDLHNGFPFLAEVIKVDSVKKLIPNLWDKKGYIFCYENLKQAEEHGLIVKNAKKVLNLQKKLGSNLSLI